MTRHPSHGAAPRSLARLALDAPALDRIAAKAQWLDLLDALLRAMLPPALAAHCRLANVRQDRLVWLVADAAAGVRLRPHLAALEERAARESGRPIQGSVIRVAPRQQNFPPPKAPSAVEQAHLARLATLLGIDAESRAPAKNR
jgi:hypothetical protein